MSEHDEAQLPIPDPPVSVETKPFFDAAAEGRLVLPKCRDCGWVIWYPRQFCNACGSLSVEWVPASGKGQIYTFTIVRRGEGAYRGATPYVLAYVELEEGPRVMTNIVGADPARLRVGDPVVATIQPAENGAALVRFRPSSSTNGSS